MATTKIRGITIELGADTSGLSKALKNVNTEIGKTQKDLKDVEKLLKLDPKNTELLEQKQRLLNDRIGETKTKLEALKQAQSQVDLSTEEGQRQYDALTREIASCETELKQLESQASKSKQALEKIGEAGEKLKDIGGKVTDVGKSMTTHVTAPVAAAGAAIVKTAGDFEQQMAKVSGIAQAYGGDLDSLKEKALELSEKTQFSATEIAQAYEYMGMAGWNTNQILAGTPGILDLATASGEDLAQVSDIVTDGLTAFGLKAEDTSRFVNVLAEAARSSNTNVGLMGESFKYVGPVAGAMGYEIEDVALALGLMANSGIKGSMAGTSLRNMLQRMAKPTKESAMAMDRLGLSLTDDNGKMLSFGEILDQLRGSMGEINMPLEEYNRQLDELDAALEDGSIKQKEYDKELEELNLQAFGAEGAEKARAAAMLGGTRAMAGLMAISEATTEDYNNLKDSIQGSSDTMVRTANGSVKTLNKALEDGDEIIEEYNGTAAAMAGTMNDTANVQMKQFTNQLQNLGIQFGETVLPMLSQFLDKLSDMLDKFKSLTPEQQQMIVNFALIAAAIGPVLSVIGRLMTGLGGIMTAVPKIAGGLSKIGAGFASIGAKIGPAAAKIAEFGSGLVGKLSGALPAIGQFFTADFGATMAAGGATAAATAGAAIVGGLTAFIGGSEIGKKVGEWIFPDDKELYEKYEGVKGTFELYKDFFVTLGEEISDKVGGAWDTVKEATGTMVERTSEHFDKFKQKSTQTWDDVKEAARTFVERTDEHWTNAANSLKNFSDGAKEKLENFKNEIGNFKDKVSESVKNVSDKFDELKKNASEKIEELAKKFGEKVSDIQGKFNDWKSKVDQLKTDISKKFNDIKDSIVKAFDGIRDGVKGPINSVLGFFEKMVNGIIDAWNGLADRLGSFDIDVPDWVTEKTGITDFSLSLRKFDRISIPRLANGGVMTNGTAVVGEAGAELLSVKNGQAMVQPLGGQNGAAELTDLLETYLPYLAMRQNILLDGKALVGQTAASMNEALGQISYRGKYA